MKHLDPSHGGALTLCLLLAASCGGGTSAPADPGDAARLDPRPGTGPVRSLLLKAEARDALGLVLKQAELRGRGPLLEFPGAIEPAFDALQVAAAPLDGRVEVVALPLSEVEAGELLFRIDAPSWRSLQADLAAVRAELGGHVAWFEEAKSLELAHHRHEEALSALEGRWADRLEQLDAIRDAGGGQAAALVNAQASLLDARARLAEAQEVGARLAVDRAERLASRASAEARRESLLARATTLTGVPVAELVGGSEKELEGGHDDGRTWWTIDRIEVRAQRPGQLLSLETTDGAWAEAGDPVVRVRRRGAVQVKGAVFQADLPRLTDGSRVVVRPASGIRSGIRSGIGSEVEATLRSGLTADARERSAEIFAFFSGPEPPIWARPGLSVVVSIPAPGPVVEITTTAEGLSAEQVEELVTAPLEDALQVSAGVAGMASTSSGGRSMVSVAFETSVAAEEARARVTAGLELAAAELPPGAAASVSGLVASSRVAVPTAALRRDGVERVVWVENPARPVELIAVPVVVLEEGPEWTFIESPIEPGNRVVARGAGRLALAAQGASQAGGHFHADGSFHAEEH